VNLVEYLAKASEYLMRHGVASSRLNSELLLANLLGISRLDIYTNFDRPLAEAEANAYREALARRAGGCPLQYITGEAGFRGVTLEVAPGVFIPRPETEVLVKKALEVLEEPEAACRVLDLGTGCGNIAVSIAVERPRAVLVAVDCDEAATALCARNASKADVEGRVDVRVGDLFEPLDGVAPFDLILSNPPYIPVAMRDSLPVEVRDFEPEQALFAGPDGLDVIRRIIDGAPPRLVAGGWLALEVDESHADVVAEELESAGWLDVEVFEDLALRPRIARARRG